MNACMDGSVNESNGWMDGWMDESFSSLCLFTPFNILNK